MSEQRIDTVARRAASAPAAAGQETRKPFVRPAVHDLGSLTLFTLTTQIPVPP